MKSGYQKTANRQGPGQPKEFDPWGAKTRRPKKVDTCKFHRLMCLAFLLSGLSLFPASHVLAAPPRNSPTQATTLQQLSPRGDAALRGYLKAGIVPELRWPTFRDYQNQAKQFYESIGNSLAWVRGNKPTPQALAIIRALETSDRKGLDPEDYDGPRWKRHLAALHSPRYLSESDLAESNFVRFDVALTISTMRYVSDLHSGRVNPRQVPFGVEIARHRYDLPEFLRQRLIQSANVASSLQQVEPTSPEYRRTVAALDHYLQLAAADAGGNLPPANKTISPGETYAGVPRLARLLQLLGDLSAGAKISPSGMVYQGPLVKAIERFQKRHGLEPDGRIGRQTFRELNTPLARRVVQLKLALERLRWIPQTIKPPVVFVNVPEFQLSVENEQGRCVLSMKVIAGKARSNQTPVFSSAIQNIIFRPAWTVPVDITRNELIPQIEKNPAYLTKNHYQIISPQGIPLPDKVLDEDTLEQLRAGALRLRQLPGPTNSLGLVKFDMPNDYQVYMHGTPAAGLFKRARRDFSHGCIRVEDPVALAAWLLRDQPVWNPDHIRAAMNGDEPLRVPLTKPIPVMIVYVTATVTQEGDIHFADDIYKLDAALEEALADRHVHPN